MKNILECMGLGLVLAITILSSCKEEPIIPGMYSSHPPTQLDLLVLKSQGYTGYVMGESLELAADSTFAFETCGHIVKGHWSGDHDGIRLISLEAAQRVDSLYAIPVPLDSVPFYKEEIIFKKSGGFLLRVSDGRVHKMELDKS